MTVAKTGGESSKEELLHHPLGRSDGVDDNNAKDFPLCSLWKDSEDNGPPAPCRSYNNTTKLTDSY